MSRQRTNIVHNGLCVDRISRLPENLQDCILSKLTILDAVRTSLLSRTWRYKWLSVSDLVFNDLGLQNLFLNKPPQAQDRLIRNIVSKVLLQHSDDITEFALSLRNLEKNLDIDAWIMNLWSKSVEDFTLELWRGERYRLHSRLFCFPELCNLTLRHCVIQLPSLFTGFECLTRMSLSYVTIAADAFESLTAKCLVLDFLVMIEVDGLDCINVFAPKISTFMFFGEFKKISFKICTPLTSVGFTTLPEMSPVENPINRPSLSTELEVLEADRNFMQVLCAYNWSFKHLIFDLPLRSLVDFKLCLRFQDIAAMTGLLKLIAILPYLQILTVESHTDPAADKEHVTKRIKKESSELGSLELRVVFVEGVIGSSPEMEFIKMLLSKSPFLETMTVKVDKDKLICADKEILKELLSFGRSSARAQIIFSD